MKVGQLKEIIRSIVAVELQRQLPSVVEHMITEKYLKKLMTEQNNKKPVYVSKIKHISLAERLGLVDDDDDDYENVVPAPLHNDDKGIYQNNPLIHENEQSKSSFISSNNPLSFIYEGVKPISNVTKKQDDEGISLDILDKRLGLGFTKMTNSVNSAKINNINEVKQPDQVKRAHNPEWDRFVDTRPQDERNDASMNVVTKRMPMIKAPQHSIQSHPLLEGPVFPTSPIVLKE